jgi:RNA polymerase sigma-70 factor, ECF subfamily
MEAPAEHDPWADGLGELLPRLRRFARALSGNQDDADDLVQVSLERALARRSQWDSSRRLDSWLFGIIRNAWIDELRSRRRGQALFADEALGERVGVSTMEGYMTGLSVESAMRMLPVDQRAAIALVLIEGLSYREAARVLDVPMGTLTSRLARGREALQATLGEGK